MCQFTIRNFRILQWHLLSLSLTYFLLFESTTTHLKHCYSFVTRTEHWRLLMSDLLSFQAMYRRGILKQKFTFAYRIKHCQLLTHTLTYFVVFQLQQRNMKMQFCLLAELTLTLTSTYFLIFYASVYYLKQTFKFFYHIICTKNWA